LELFSSQLVERKLVQKKGGIAGSLAVPLGAGLGIVGGAIVGGIIGYTAYTVGFRLF